MSRRTAPAAVTPTEKKSCAYANEQIPSSQFRLPGCLGTITPFNTNHGLADRWQAGRAGIVDGPMQSECNTSHAAKSADPRVDFIRSTTLPPPTAETQGSDIAGEMGDLKMPSGRSAMGTG